MKIFKINLLLVVFGIGLWLWSCSDDDSSTDDDVSITDDDGSGTDDGDTGSSESFDRGVMLVNWADNIIVPAYQAFDLEVDALKMASDNFENTTDEANFNTLREAWEDAYIAFQNVSAFLVGPSEDVFFRSFLNTYPLNADNVDEFIATGDYNLIGSTTFDEQGFPALDYLLYGLADSDAEILNFYTDSSTASNYLNFLTDVVDRIDELTEQVVSEWEGDYRDEFVANDGSSSTSSTNRLVNDYIQYYERNFRDGKVGIPAGIRSDGVPQPERVEAFYRKNLSKTLYNEALAAYVDFFNGISFDGELDGESLADYLDFLNTMKDGEDLSTLINNQFDDTEDAAAPLGDSFFDEVNNNTVAMVNLFDEMQENIVLLKSDMTSALSISIDFADSDGD